MEDLNLKKPLNLLATKKGMPVWLKISLTFFLIIFLSLSVALIASASYVASYKDRIYPGVYVDSYNLGGMSRSDLDNFIETINNRLAKDGIGLDAVVDGKHTAIRINTVSLGENSTELVKLDSYLLWQKAFAVGRSGDWLAQTIYPWYYRFNHDELGVPIRTDWVNLLDILKDSLGNLATGPRNAGIHITALSPLAYEVVPEQSGLVFSYEKIINKIQNNLSQLYLGDVVVNAELFEPDIKLADVQSAAQNLSQFLNYGDISLNYIDPQTKARHDWEITPKQYADWLEVGRDADKNPIFVLNQERVKVFLESLRYLVDRLPHDAKFSVDENGKVKEFQASQSGLTLNAEKTFSDLNSAFKDRNYHPTQVNKTVALSVDIADPIVKTADVNNLGIEDIIGVGYSTFKDSHNNRIKNIAHAVDRLNGVLIKPDEEFSAIRYAGPFTAENGYLPEAIIKGTEIKDEIGGGMCQIGTTLFRMAMNSGMDITARQNHSLVVSYYADPVNGNPGTDAALYEPFLDLKFKNDTGNYLLLQTDIDYKKQQLTFTLWGKPDGRSGSYTHPIVKKWIDPGDPEEIKTDKIKIGDTKCQNAFKGAIASFTYTRTTPDGQKIDRVFNSYYRPLPKICMVGVDPETLNSTSTPQ